MHIMTSQIIRFFDLIFSITGILILMPVFLIISIIIIFESKGGIFFKQIRVGKNETEFKVIKFRTMYIGSDKSSLITVGGRDARITKSGYLLRKYKIDELPQLINVLSGEMSLVGPRPEVRKYIDYYNLDQKKVLSIKPGITDWASIEFKDENEILEKASNPEHEYIHNILPHKIKLNLIFIDRYSIKEYYKIIFTTIIKVLF